MDELIEQSFRHHHILDLLGKGGLDVTNSSISDLVNSNIAVGEVS